MSSAADAEYPPEPWTLAGVAYLSVWRLDLRALPRLPAGTHPLSLAGQALVVTAWIDYQACGDLAYHELLSTVAVRDRFRATGSITEIWVDSLASLAGGRALWGIPKELATFDFPSAGNSRGAAALGAAAASSTDDWIATAAFRPRSLPAVPTRTTFRIAQEASGQAQRTDVRANSRQRPAAASWHINPDGPLAYLSGKRPLASFQVSSFELRFGG